MDQGIMITLGFLDNQSNKTYVGKYGRGHKITLDHGQKVELKRSLLYLQPNQQFPVEAKIVLNAQMPLGYPGEGFSVQSLHLKAVEYCLLNIKNIFEKRHNLEPNQQYVLNLTIDVNDDFFYELVKEKE
jgi:hypothetical protein